MAELFYMPGRNVTAQADVCPDNLMMSWALRVSWQ